MLVSQSNPTLELLPVSSTSPPSILPYTIQKEFRVTKEAAAFQR